MAHPAVTIPPRQTLQHWLSVAAEIDRAHPQVADAAIAAALAVVAVPWTVVHTAGGTAQWLCNFGLIVPLVWRRRYPLGVLATIAVVAFVQWLVGGLLIADVALLGMLFTVALERPIKTAIAAAVVIEVGAIMASVRWDIADSWDRSLVGLTALTGVALLLGAGLRARRFHLAQLTERAARLELERDQQAQIAAAAERTRIAREMHDVIAHSLAVIVTMSEGASAKLGRDPETAASAIGVITDVGRQALADTRRLLGVLRDDAADVDMTPQPGLAALDELVVKLRATGLEASLRYQGLPFDLAPGAELTIYRLVQEAATNTLKHGKAATRFGVSLTFSHPTVTVEAVDDGQATGARDAGRVVSGHGLAGMRERVALYQGRVIAGPGPEGGWTVHASLEAAAHS